MTASRVFYDKAQWQKDEACLVCTKCRRAFSLVFRRHHCRICGFIFCSYCSTQRIKLDVSKFGIAQRTIPVGYFESFTQYLNREERVRVCDTCYQGRGEKFISDALFNYSSSIHLLKLLSQLNKEFKLAASVRLNDFRRIQYILPNASLKFDEHTLNRKILLENRQYLRGHKYLVMHLIKFTTFPAQAKAGHCDSDKTIEQVVAMFDVHPPPRQIKCSSLLCTKKCDNVFGDAEALELLNIAGLDFRLYERSIAILRRNLGVQILETPRIPVDTVTLKCYLVHLANCLQHNSIEGQQDLLLSFLVDACTLSDISITNELFWILKTKIQAEKCPHTELYKLILVKIQTLFEGFGQAANFDKSVSQLKSVADVPKIDLTTSFPSPVPCKPELIGESADLLKCAVKNSATHPVVFPIKIKNQEKPLLVLYKSEDLRNDQTVVNIMTIMDLIIKKELGLDLGIVRFNVVPTSPSTGFVEIVQNAITLDDIQKKQYSLQNWIIKHNQHEAAIVWRKRFLSSLVAFCLINHLLGLGDRHLANIMILDPGQVFHIDFGYILGCDPRPNPVKMRLTTAMIDALGGEVSEEYQDFLSTFKLVYNQVRRHANLISVLLTPLHEANPPIEGDRFSFTREAFYRQILERYQPGVPDEEAAKEILEVLESSKNAIQPGIVDWLRWNQGVPMKTVVSGVEIGKSLLSSTYGYFLSWYSGDETPSR